MMDPTDELPRASLQRILLEQAALSDQDDPTDEQEPHLRQASRIDEQPSGTFKIPRI